MLITRETKLAIVKKHLEDGVTLQELSEEFEIMKTHSELGKEIIDKAVSDIESDGYLQEARNMAAYHHERWDGKGTRFDPRCVEVFLESLPEVKDVLRRLNPEYKDEESNEGN